MHNISTNEIEEIVTQAILDTIQSSDPSKLNLALVPILDTEGLLVEYVGSGKRLLLPTTALESVTIGELERTPEYTKEELKLRISAVIRSEIEDEAIGMRPVSIGTIV